MAFDDEVLNAMICAFRIRLKKVNGLSPARTRRMEPYVTIAWSRRPNTTTSEYTRRLRSRSNPDSATMAAISANTAYGASFMIQSIMTMQVWFTPSKNETTASFLGGSISVRAAPKMTVKTIRASRSISAAA